jgi:hypothetical protein
MYLSIFCIGLHNWSWGSEILMAVTLRKAVFWNLIVINVSEEVATAIFWVEQ